MKEQNKTLVELKELIEEQTFTSEESVAIQIENIHENDSGTSILMDIIEHMKRNQHETATEALKQNHKLMEENAAIFTNGVKGSHSHSLCRQAQ